MVFNLQINQQKLCDRTLHGPFNTLYMDQEALHHLLIERAINIIMIEFLFYILFYFLFSCIY